MRERAHATSLYRMSTLCQGLVSSLARDGLFVSFCKYLGSGHCGALEIVLQDMSAGPAGSSWVHLTGSSHRLAILTFTVVYIKAPSGLKPQSQLLLRDLVELVVLAQDVDRAARRGGASLLALAPVVVHLVHLRSCAENVRGRGL